MSVTNLDARIGVAEPDSRTNDGAERREIQGHFANEVLVAGELLAIDEFIAGVLRRASQTVEPLRSPSEHRTILRLAHLFADDLAQTDRSFDRLRFIEAAIEEPA
jgi:hypothetical protein